MSSSSPAQDHTEVRMKRITYSWCIERFALLPVDVDVKIWSEWFYSKDKSEKWRLEFYPRGQLNISGDGVDHVALYLARDSPEKSKITVHVEMEIFKCNERITKRFNTYEYGPHDRQGYYRFVERSKLIARNLDRDQFTITCVIDIPADPITSSGAIIFDSKNSQLSNNLRLLFEDPKFSDFTIIVGDKKFATHKVILASRSSVFAAMFEHKDMKKNRKNEVKIENTEPDVIKRMLEFIYTDQVTNLKELASGVLVAADKYDLEQLRFRCEEALYEGLNKDNAAEVLLLADLHRADTLKKGVMKYIVRHASEVVKSNNWKKIEWNLELLLELFDQLVLPQTVNNEKSHSSKV